MLRHPRFAFEKFASLFNLADLRRDAVERARELLAEQGEPITAASVAERAALIGPSGTQVTSPVHLAVVELLRREVVGATVPRGATPCDVFVFGLGEPRAPYLTKLGGHPYRARSRPWPKTADGRDRFFVGQLCFVDSRDIAPAAKGDVLLAFADPEGTSAFAFEWSSVGEGEVLGDGDVPDAWCTTHDVNPFLNRNAKPVRVKVPRLGVVHGVVHRTWDLPAEDQRFAAMDGGARVARLEGTKIGGVAVDVKRRGPFAGSYVGAIGSVGPESEVAFPWHDQQAALSTREAHAGGFWQLGDAGVLDIFRDALGAIVARGGGY